MSASRLQHRRIGKEPVAWFDGLGESVDGQMAAMLGRHGHHKAEGAWEEYVRSWEQCLASEAVKADVQTISADVRTDTTASSSGSW